MCKCQYAHSKKKYFSKLDTKYPKESNGIGKTVALNYSYVLYHNGTEQRFSTDMLWQARCCAARIFKYVVPDYLVRDTGLFSLRLSIEKKKKKTTASTTIVASVNESKLYLFLEDQQKKFF